MKIVSSFYQLWISFAINLVRTFCYFYHFKIVFDFDNSWWNLWYVENPKNSFEQMKTPNNDTKNKQKPEMPIQLVQRYPKTFHPKTQSKTWTNHWNAPAIWILAIHTHVHLLNCTITSSSSWPRQSTVRLLLWSDLCVLCSASTLPLICFYWTV